MQIVADAKIALVEAAFSDFGDLVALPSTEMIPERVQEADLLLVRSETRVDRKLLEGSRVRFVATATSGTDHVDLAYLKERGIGFAGAPGCNAEAVAQYVATALLRLSTRQQEPLRGKRLGVVGVGRIGRRVVRTARLLGLEVLLNDPPLARETGEGRFLALDELMDVDFLTIHVPLTAVESDRTYHLFDENRISRLSPGLILINTARGPVVDNRALKQALAKGRIGGAILDVWENEPDIDLDLLSQVEIGTPHIAGYSADGKIAGTRMAYEAVCRHLNRPPVFDCSAHLPAPRTREIKLPAIRSGIQEVLDRVVRRCYEIETDDARLRRVAAAGRRRL